MEKIKSYHSIKTFLSDEKRKVVADLLNLTNEDLNRRMEGKEAEYEFLLRCYFLNEIKDIIAFEEGISRLTRTVTTDFLFVTKKGKRLAIEIKSTEKDSWKISQKVFIKKKSFAELMNAELYFAVRIRGQWMFLSSEHIIKNNYKITINSLRQSSNEILGDRSFVFLDSFTIKSIYTNDQSDSLGILHPEYGYLERYTLESKKKVIFKVSKSNKDKIFIPICLEAIQDSASNHFQEIKSLGLGRTLIVEKLMENTQMNLSHFLISPITHQLSDISEMAYDFSSYITEIVDQKNQTSIKIDHIIYVLGLMCKSGINIAQVRHNELYKFQDIYDMRNL